MKWARKPVSTRVLLLFCLAFFLLGIYFGLQLYTVVPYRALIAFFIVPVSMGLVLVASYLRSQEVKGVDTNR